MAASFYTPALLALHTGDLRLAHDELRLMLVSTGYEFDRLQSAVDNGTGSDLQSHELSSVTNYSRKSIEPTIEADAAGLISITFPDTSWSNLGGGTNGTVGAVVLIRVGEDGDSGAMPILYFSQAPYTTNGGTYLVDFESDWQVRTTQQN